MIPANLIMNEFDKGVERMKAYAEQTKGTFKKFIDVGMEPVGPLAGKVPKIIPHVPFYKADGNTVVREWEEEFEDRCGNRATLIKVEFITKKGKLNETVIRVKWEK